MKLTKKLLSAVIAGTMAITSFAGGMPNILSLTDSSMTVFSQELSATNSARGVINSSGEIKESDYIIKNNDALVSNINGDGIYTSIFNFPNFHDFPSSYYITFDILPPNSDTPYISSGTDDISLRLISAKVNDEQIDQSIIDTMSSSLWSSIIITDLFLDNSRFIDVSYVELTYEVNGISNYGKTTTPQNTTTATTKVTTKTTTTKTTISKTSIVSSGKCGTNVKWELDNAGTLTLSGKGDTYDYHLNDSPFSDNPDIENVVISEGVTSIGECLFDFSNYDYCHGPKSVIIPDSVTNIGAGAFHSCYDLKSINIPDSVFNIGDYAFSLCKNLTNITIPNSVTWLGTGVFWDCSALTNVSISNKITTIYENMFNGCSSLRRITVPNGVTDIGDSAFAGCSSLTSIMLPDSVTRIGWEAFAGCSALTSVTVPKSVMSICKNAFSECNQLLDVTILNPNCDIHDFATTIFSSKIIGYNNSTAQSYAEKYGYAFEALDNVPVVTSPAVTTTIKTTTTKTTTTKVTTTTAATTKNDSESLYDGDAYLKGDPVNSASGTIVNLPVYLRLDANVYPKYIEGIAFKAVYDTSALELLNIYEPDKSGLSNGEMKADISKGVFHYYSQNGNVAVAPGYPICVYRFRVKADAATAEYPVVFKNSNNDNEPVMIIHKQNDSGTATYLTPHITNGLIKNINYAATTVVTTPAVVNTVNNPLGLRLTADKTSFYLSEIKGGKTINVYIDPAGDVSKNDKIGSVEFKLKSSAWGTVDPINLMLSNDNALGSMVGNIVGDYSFNRTGTMTISKWEDEKPENVGYTLRDFNNINDFSGIYSDVWCPQLIIISDSSKGFLRTDSSYGKHIAEFQISFPADLEEGSYTISFADAKSMICLDGEFGSNASVMVDTPVTESITFDIVKDPVVTEPISSLQRTYDGTASISVAQNVSAKTGETVEVPVYMELDESLKEKYITGIAFKAMFDNTALELKDIILPDDCGLSTGGFSKNLSNGVFCYTWNHKNITVDPDKPICIYKFKVKDDASGILDIKLVNHLEGYEDEYVEITHKQGDNNKSTYLIPDISGGSIKVGADAIDWSKVYYGDADGDGFVNLSDIIVVSKYLLSPKSYPLDSATIKENADCKYDGNIDVSDLAKLIEFNLGTIKDDNLGPEDMTLRQRAERYR